MRLGHILCLLLVLAAAPSFGAQPIVLFDASKWLEMDFKNPRQRREYWDELQLLTALEGLVNRDQPRLFVRYLRTTDDFWWHEMRQPHSWLTGREIVRDRTLDELLARFRQYYHGAVVWDEDVPATSNLGSTIAGCDDLLPLRYDASPESLYRRLTDGPTALPVKVRIPKFTGAGIIPGTRIPSSGSVKCDAYLWLIEKYVRSGKANPFYLGYYLDAFWLKCWKAGLPENNALCNHDFIIARRGVLFDLDVWDDEAPIDDPKQRPGTDAATLQILLRACYDRFAGNGIIEAAGFIPWAYKYTDYRGRFWSAGGGHEGVATEWRYGEILSCFNACMDADALGLEAMPNASFYQHYPLATFYPQNAKPSRDTLAAGRLIDASGRVVPRTYVAFYVGDYDSSAWLYQKLPQMWRDKARGETPLSWAFDPNLCLRFPFGMAWARARRTANDWFVAGDSGAGYLNPSRLTPPRPWSGLPGGLEPWTDRCEHFYKQWDLTLTGFIINGDAPQPSSEVLDAYARFSPDGIVMQGAEQSVHHGMPILPMASDIIETDPSEAARHILELSHGPGPHFVACRSILRTPTWHWQVQQELLRLRGDRIRVVDLYTLLQLVRAAGH